MKLSRPKVVLLSLLAWLAAFAVLVVVTNVDAPFTRSLVGALSLPVYLLPTTIAFLRRHHNALAIGILNIIFGALAVVQMTVGASPVMALISIGLSWITWFVALIWSFTRPAPTQPPPTAAR